MSQDSQRPLLSVVIALISDTTGSYGGMFHLTGCLEALAQQRDPPAMEVIVPYLTGVHRVEQIESRYPSVRFVPVDSSRKPVDPAAQRESIDVLRACGLEAARGEIVALVEDVGRPDRGWSASLVEAHKSEYAAIGGAMENGIDLPLNWAVYFCDFVKYQNPVPEGESAFVSDANVAYKRSALQATRSIWQDAFHETDVNWALVAQGAKLALAPKMVVLQHRTDLELGSALRERFSWGRYYAARRGDLLGRFRRIVYGLVSPALPVAIVLRMTWTVIKKGRNIGAFLKALPLIVLLTLSWSLAELVGYLTGRTSSSDVSTVENTARAGTG